MQSSSSGPSLCFASVLCTADLVVAVTLALATGAGTETGTGTWGHWLADLIRLLTHSEMAAQRYTLAQAEGGRLCSHARSGPSLVGTAISWNASAGISADPTASW